jgi:hypothetical protein
MFIAEEENQKTFHSEAAARSGKMLRNKSLLLLFFRKEVLASLPSCFKDQA